MRHLKPGDADLGTSSVAASTTRLFLGTALTPPCATVLGGGELFTVAFWSA